VSLPAIFDFFELLAEEFDGKNEVFFGVGRLQHSDGNPSALSIALRKELRAKSDLELIDKSYDGIKAHFDLKKVPVPFSYDSKTSRFFNPNQAFLDFVRKCRTFRSLGQRAQEFELTIMQRLAERLDGEFHRVGHPRQVKKTIVEVNKHLKDNFSFYHDILAGKEKDGGLDILWKLPLGSDPFVPIIAIQCKNGHFNSSEAAHSNQTCGASLNKHMWLHKEVHLKCVVFNDYIEPKILFAKGAEYVPIGISDLLRDRAATKSVAI
jgi:hypothetical protein